MRKKKKMRFWITFGVVSLFVVVAVLGIVISRIQSVTSGQLNTNYQAGKNIQATLSGGYKLSGESEQKLITEDGKNEIVFNTGDSTIPTNQNFKKVDNIKLQKNKEFHVRYKIQNNNLNDTLVCNFETDIENCSNINVQYSINNANWYTNPEVIFGTNGKSIANNKIMYLYIKISIANNLLNAKFDGSFNFILSTLE